MRRPRFLDKKKVVRDLAGLARKVMAEDASVEKVILFGSLAGDTFTARSDADLLIVLKDSDLRFLDRIPRFLLLFAGAPVPTDVFPYTEEETKRVSLARRAISTGVVLSARAKRGRA